MDILQNVTETFKPAVDAAKDQPNLITVIIQVENSVARQLLECEARLIAMQSEVEKAKAKHEVWIQYMWRPLTMVVFVTLITLDSLGLLPKPMAPQMWTLLELGLGGYVIGRSAERLVPAVIDKFKTTPTGNKG